MHCLLQRNFLIPQNIRVFKTSSSRCVFIKDHYFLQLDLLFFHPLLTQPCNFTKCLLKNPFTFFFSSTAVCFVLNQHFHTRPLYLWPHILSPRLALNPSRFFTASLSLSLGLSLKIVGLCKLKCSFLSNNLNSDSQKGSSHY